MALDEAAGGDRAFHRASQGAQADGEVPALKGTEGDKVNAVLSAAAMNFSKLLTLLGALWSYFLERFVALFASRSPRETIAPTAG